MSLFEGITAFIHELDHLGIQYEVIRGIAVFAYGGERTTFDVDFLIDGKHRDELKNLAKRMKLNIVNENAEVLQFSGAVQINIVFTYRPANMRSQKTNLSFQQYCAKIEELLKLTGRKIKPRAKIEPTAFVL